LASWVDKNPAGLDSKNGYTLLMISLTIIKSVQLHLQKTMQCLRK